MSDIMKRQYNKGRFVVTECESPRDDVFGSVSKAGKKDTSKASKPALASRPDASVKPLKGERVVKKGRFKVFTCCRSDVKDFGEEDRELLSGDSASRDVWPGAETVGLCDALEIFIPENDDVLPAHANPIKVADCTAVGDQGPQLLLDTFSNSSWDSASSLSSACLESKTPRGRGRFSEPGMGSPGQLCNLSAAVASPCSSTSSTAIYQPTYVSRVSVPRSVSEMTVGPVVRSYKRGRFAVEESLLRCPVTNVARSISCPTSGSSSCGREAPLLDMVGGSAGNSNSPVAAAGARRGQQAAGHASDAWGLDEDGDGIGDLPQCRRHTTVSYFRRGRFLVQTVV